MKVIFFFLFTFSSKYTSGCNIQISLAQLLGSGGSVILHRWAVQNAQADRIHLVSGGTRLLIYNPVLWRPPCNCRELSPKQVQWYHPIKTLRAPFRAGNCFYCCSPLLFVKTLKYNQAFFLYKISSRIMKMLHVLLPGWNDRFHHYGKEELP